MGARKLEPVLGSRPGRAKCLRCGKMFSSVDVTTNRICPKCTGDNNREYVPRMTSGTVYVGGRACNIPSEE